MSPTVCWWDGFGINMGLIWGLVHSIDSCRTDHISNMMTVRLLVACFLMPALAFGLEVRTGLHPELGVVVTKYKDAMMGQSTLEVLLRLDNVEEPEWTTGINPCAIVGQINRMVVPQTQWQHLRTMNLTTELNKLCVSYQRLRHAQHKISLAYTYDIVMMIC